MHDDSIIGDLSRFDREFVAQANFQPGLDTIDNGPHEFEILSAELGRTKNVSDPILRVNLRVDGGCVVEWGTPLKTQESANRIGADLCVLGFDAEKWRPSFNRKFSEELGKAVPRLKGIKFKAIKRAEDGSDGKTYHKLLLVMRLTGTANGPARSAPPPTPRQGTPAARPAAEQNAVPAGAGGADIPF